MGPVQKQSVRPAGIEVRHCQQLEEFQECVRLQQLTWSEDIVVPAAVFVVALETGGQVLGAFEGSRMIGFTMALGGFHRGGKILLHSHMTAVLPEFRDRGVGRMLKLLQRDDALRRGINLVEWTFDPLELKNAYFNIVRLGAIVRRFIPNCYGITDSPLHSGLPTDRLVAEWWLDSARVKTILAGAAAPPGKSVERIAVPANIAELRQHDRQAAAQQQTRIRQEFERWFTQRYVVTGIERAQEIVSYVFEPWESVTIATPLDG